MPRRSIEKLPRSRAPYKIDLLSPGFETAEASRKEDAFRVRGLRGSCVLPNELFDVKAASALAKRLDYEARGTAPPKSLACSLYMRRVRQRFFGHLLKAIHESGAKRVSRFDLVARGWDFTPEELDQADPNKLLTGLRMDLYRSSAAEADGIMSASVHGEFEPEEGIYQLHVHGAATDGMIDVVDALRSRRKYKSGGGVRNRVVISRKRILNLPYRITYVLKSFWSCRRIGPRAVSHPIPAVAGSLAPERHHAAHPFIGRQRRFPYQRQERRMSFMPHRIVSVTRSSRRVKVYTNDGPRFAKYLSTGALDAKDECIYAS